MGVHEKLVNRQLKIHKIKHIPCDTPFGGLLEKMQLFGENKIEIDLDVYFFIL